jgi:DNA (cytosine-5)-methyltransferase 1
MKFISFFAGIGGFDLGLERAGHECVGQVEIDKNCNKVLNYQYPNVKKFKDISKVNPDELPKADLYVGGFPCQDLSIANTRRKGLHGKRSSLWHEFIRCFEIRKPTYIVAENVPGLLSARNGQDMGTVVRSLADRGYSCEWRVLDSQYFGVPQRRRRVFLVATHIQRHLGGKTYKPILFEQKGLSGYPRKGNEEKSTNPRHIKKSIRKTKSRVNSYATSHVSMREGHRVYDIKGISPPSRAGHPHQILDTFVKKHRASNKDDYENWEKSGLHPTLSCWDQGDSRAVAVAITKDYKIRRLTPVECERLQGFPSNWTQKGIDEKGNEVNIAQTARYKQCGNAVTVNVAEWIGKRLKIMCGRKDDREFWEWWYSLTPAEQEQHIGR